MTSVTFATPFRTAPRAFHYSAPPRPFSDDAGAALNEAEASELAVRLIGARSEAKFNHLPAARAGGSLPAALRWALPRYAFDFEQYLPKGKNIAEAALKSVGGQVPGGAGPSRTASACRTRCSALMSTMRSVSPLGPVFVPQQPVGLCR